MNELKLCYVSKDWAYFTTQALDKQWGDDWDDAPYEHNAGEPYESWKKGETPWKIVKVAFEGDFTQPCDSFINSSCSVQMINKGGIAWLRSPSYGPLKVVIHAGTTLAEFKRLVGIAEGLVYEVSKEVAS